MYDLNLMTCKMRVNISIRSVKQKTENVKRWQYQLVPGLLRGVLKWNQKPCLLSLWHAWGIVAGPWGIGES